MKNSQEELKPIHKFNNGMGATLCNECYVIISKGLTEELFCEKCKPKQETLEENKLRQLFKNRSNCYADAEDVVQAMDENCFIETIKEWQAERMYNNSSKN
jgi:hypothetical protein